MCYNHIGHFDNANIKPLVFFLHLRFDCNSRRNLFLWGETTENRILKKNILSYLNAYYCDSFTIIKLTPASMPLATSVRVAAACILAGLATTTGANVLDGAKATKGINRIKMEHMDKYDVTS